MKLMKFDLNNIHFFILLLIKVSNKSFSKLLFYVCFCSNASSTYSIASSNYLSYYPYSPLVKYYFDYLNLLVYFLFSSCVLSCLRLFCQTSFSEDLFVTCYWSKVTCSCCRHCIWRVLCLEGILYWLFNLS